MTAAYKASRDVLHKRLPALPLTSFELKAEGCVTIRQHGSPRRCECLALSAELREGEISISQF